VAPPKGETEGGADQPRLGKDHKGGVKGEKGCSTHNKRGGGVNTHTAGRGERQC